jgi:hypothetical protein
MICMYPSYIHVIIATFHDSINNRHVLYLYNEVYKKIDYYLHLTKLSKVSSFFIPCSGGSYK